MLLCAVGDIHGAIDRMYDDVLSLEASLGVHFEWILHVGDFGIWPDPKRIDRAAKKHDGAGDFPAWLADRRIAPRKTVFIKGNHEDCVWLDAQPIPEILPGLFYLRNGGTMNLGESGDIVQIGGVGGCYSPSDFELQSKHLQGYAKRHYTRDEIEVISSMSMVDIVLVHDAPAGIRFAAHRRGSGWVSEAAGLDLLISRLRPLVCFFGHHHVRVDGELAGTRCIGGSTGCACQAIWSRSTLIGVGASGRFSANGRRAARHGGWRGSSPLAAGGTCSGGIGAAASPSTLKFSERGVSIRIFVIY